MLLSPRKDGLTSLFKEVRVFKVSAESKKKKISEDMGPERQSQERRTLCKNPPQKNLFLVPESLGCCLLE